MVRSVKAAADMLCAELKGHVSGEDSDVILILGVGFFREDSGEDGKLREFHDIWVRASSAKRDEFVDHIIRHFSEHEDYVDILRSAMNPTRLKILAACVDGASESEISEIVGMKGGALHYHLRDMVFHGLLAKEQRGKYALTDSGLYLLVFASSFPPKNVSAADSEEM